MSSWGDKVDNVRAQANQAYERVVPQHHYPPPPHGAYRNNTGCSNIVLYILAIFLPPVPVFLKTGCGAHLFINLILWFLCWLPGVLHAFWVIATM